MKPPLSPMARAFLAANAQSPVIYGAAHGRGGKGGIYRLANAMTFDLTAADMRAIGEPCWAFEEQVA